MEVTWAVQLGGGAQEGSGEPAALSEIGAETFSGPLNRLPILVPERGRDRQTD